MKVITAQEMARIEKLAFASGASEEGFMDRAAEGVVQAALRFLKQRRLPSKVALLCGKGNNAADAYMAGCLLRKQGVETTAFAIAPLEGSSPLCQKKGALFGKSTLISDPAHFSLEGFSLIIDGLLGTGFKGCVEGILALVIRMANRSHIPILSIDIPSGVNGTNGAIEGEAIRADHTLFLGLPKTGCFIGEAWAHTGEMSVWNFGLDEALIAQAQEDYILLTPSFVRSLLPKIERTRHKYQAGLVLGVGGHRGMSGAMILAATATLKSGAGMVRLFHPSQMESAFAGALPEIIRQEIEGSDLTPLLEQMQRAKSLFVGPGMGVAKSACRLLKALLPQVELPCVIDAEALTLLAAHPLPFPKQTILTPHHGEMRRLLQNASLSAAQLLAETQKYAVKHQVIIVLKGAPTFIFSHLSPPFISTRGNPGMATAGSGDVLTGILASLLAQGLAPLDASALGVYLHGLAGEWAAWHKTSYSMVASDITDNLPQAFTTLLKQ